LLPCEATGDKGAFGVVAPKMFSYQVNFPSVILMLSVSHVSYRIARNMTGAMFAAKSFRATTKVAYSNF
jgi:hypothetical protein